MSTKYVLVLAVMILMDSAKAQSRFRPFSTSLESEQSNEFEQPEIRKKRSLLIAGGTALAYVIAIGVAQQIIGRKLYESCIANNKIPGKCFLSGKWLNWFKIENIAHKWEIYTHTAKAHAKIISKFIFEQLKVVDEPEKIDEEGSGTENTQVKGNANVTEESKQELQRDKGGAVKTSIPASSPNGSLPGKSPAKPKVTEASKAPKMAGMPLTTRRAKRAVKPNLTVKSNTTPQEIGDKLKVGETKTIKTESNPQAIIPEGFAQIGKLLVGSLISAKDDWLQERINMINNHLNQKHLLAQKMLQENKKLQNPEDKKTISEQLGINKSQFLKLSLAAELIADAREKYEMVSKRCTTYILAVRAVPLYDTKVKPPMHCGDLWKDYKKLASLHVRVIREMPPIVQKVLYADYVNRHRSRYECMGEKENDDGEKVHIAPPQGFSELSMLHPYAHLLDIKEEREDENDGNAKVEVQEGKQTPVKVQDEDKKVEVQEATKVQVPVKKEVKPGAKKPEVDVTKAKGNGPQEVAKKAKGQNARESVDVTIVEKQEKIKVTNKGIVLGTAKQVTKQTSDQVQRIPTKDTTSKGKTKGKPKIEQVDIEDLDELSETLEHSRTITMVMPYSKAKPVVAMSPNFPPKIIWHPRDGDSSAEVLFHHDP